MPQANDTKEKTMFREYAEAFMLLFNLYAKANPQNRNRKKGMEWQVQAMIDWAVQEAEHNEQVRNLLDDFRKGCVPLHPVERDTTKRPSSQS
jgi:hypothetical protein